MILKSLKLKNVKCYDEAEVSFILGKNVIIGRNGSGKSTLLQSILYSMYAQYPQGTNDQLVRTGANIAEFELELEHNGIDYLIERKLRTSGSPEAYLTEKESELEWAGTQTAVTDEIEGLVQTKKEVFRDVILVRQGEIARIVDMRSSERKNLFDRLLGLHGYEQAYRNCAGIKRLLENKVQESEGLIKAYEESAGKLDTRKKNLSELRNELKAGKNKEKKLKTELTGIENEWKRLEDLSKKIGKLESRIETQKVSLEKNKELADKLLVQTTDLCGSLKIPIPKKPTTKSMETLSQKMENRKTSLLTSVENARQVKTKLDKLSESLSSIQEQMDSVDDELSESETNATKEGGDDWRTEAKQDLDSLKGKLDQLSVEIGEAQAEYQKRSKATTKEETYEKQIKKELDGLTKLVGKQCPKCKQIVTDEHAKELAKDIRANLKQSSDKLEDLRELESESKQLVDNLENQHREMNDLINLVDRLKIYLDAEIKIIGRKEDLIGKMAEDQDNILSAASEIVAIKELGFTKSKLDKLSLQSMIEELESNLKSLQSQADSLGSLANEAQNLASLLSQIKDQEKSVEKETENLETIEKDYDSALHKKLTKTREKLKDQFSKLTERLRILRDDQIPAAKELMEESKKAAKSIESLESEQIVAKEALAVLEKIREFYREVQRPLRKRDLQRASREASEIFRTLIGSNEFERIRITEDHELQVSRLGELEPMSMLSGGEQVLASLSVRLGFARALASSDLLILDEPTAFLDDQRRAELVDTLYRVSPARQMLIVTHDDEFQRVAQRVIHIEKDETTLRSSVSWED